MMRPRLPLPWLIFVASGSTCWPPSRPPRRRWCFRPIARSCRSRSHSTRIAPCSMLGMRRAATVRGQGAAGAPNFSLFVLIDDMGFGHRSAFRRPHSHAYGGRAWPAPGCATMSSIPRRSAHRPVRPYLVVVTTT